MSFINAITGAAAGFAQNNILGLIGIILSAVGVWKIIDYVYKNYARTFISDVVSHAIPYFSGKGVSFGIFWKRNVRSVELRVNMFIDLEANMSKVVKAFMNGVAIGAAIENDPAVKEILSK
jgi:hypothetical protein